MKTQELPLPPHYRPEAVNGVWRVDYQARADEAIRWAAQHGITPAAQDGYRTALVVVDMQNTFCIPGFELFVGGRSGMGAVEDAQRLVEFIYRNLGAISLILPTLDTHRAVQIFHPVFLVDAQGRHPAPLTLVSHQDVLAGAWRFNPAAAASLGVTAEQGQRHLLHYTGQLQQRGKYDLTVWPYHAMLGGVGHALVSAVEEAIFFHTIARQCQADIQVKGESPITENYSAVGPEVLDGAQGEAIASKNDRFIRLVQEYDRVVIAGEAKSHCVAWTVADLLEQIQAVDASLARKVYLLEDCTSPVVVPGVIDYTEQADRAFARLAAAGMRLARSTEPLHAWAD
ncbi:MAG: isochorismatase [Chloroflexi bacterium]|nr:isochorismatase [Chloroflexota bacterium]